MQLCWSAATCCAVLHLLPAMLTFVILEVCLTGMLVLPAHPRHRPGKLQCTAVLCGAPPVDACCLVVQIRTSNAFLKGMLGLLAVGTLALGPLAMFNLYFMPYWINVVWLDMVTYLHHHGPEDPEEKVPWYRGEVSTCPTISFVRKAQGSL